MFNTSLSCLLIDCAIVPLQQHINELHSLVHRVTGWHCRMISAHCALLSGNSRHDGSNYFAVFTGASITFLHCILSSCVTIMIIFTFTQEFSFWIMKTKRTSVGNAFLFIYTIHTYIYILQECVLCVAFFFFFYHKIRIE